jgi:hypothetical protein
MQKKPEGEGKEDHEMFPNKRRDLRFKAIPIGQAGRYGASGMEK